MIRVFHSGFPIAVLAALLLAGAGCGKQTAGDRHAHDGAEREEGHGHPDEHGHEGEGETEEAGASYSEGEGILLVEEAARQIGLQTAEAATRKLAMRFTANARVYKTAHAHSPGNGQQPHHDSRATAIVSAQLADFLEPGHSVELDSGNGSPIQGRLVRLDVETSKAIGQVEAIIDMSDPEHRFEFGSFVKVTFDGGEREVMAVPRAALLEAASGTFVFVKKGDLFLRTPVTVGAVSDGAAEIADGLQEGDVVVTQGAVDLWLIELRFTKGGGHSH